MNTLIKVTKVNNRVVIIRYAIFLAVIFLLVLGASRISAATVCNGGNCFYTICGQDSDCGRTGFSGIQTCSNNSVYQNYTTNSCINPGRQNSYCISSSVVQLQKVCSSNQTCSYGACTGDIPQDNQTNQTTIPNYTYNPPSQSSQPATFISHYRTNCYSNNLYWYDSQKNVSDIYKSCTDSNQCTIDSCSDNACKNILRCDGSTCGVNSADYIKYCMIATTQTQTSNQPSINIQIPNLTQIQTQSSIISLTGKKESDTNWTENVSVTLNDRIDFLLTVKNIYTTPMDNVIVKVDMTNAVAYGLTIKIDNNESAGSIASGINLGTIPSGVTRTITFTGTLQSQNTENSVKVNATVTSGNIFSSDSLTIITLITAQVKSNFAAALGSSPVMMFVKSWWVWILAVIILVVLFVVIYRRISYEI